MKLTKRVIDSIPFPETSQTLCWDDELPGYGLRVTSGAKTFIVQRRVAGKTVRVTLGRYGHLTPDQARKLAVKTLSELVHGVNVNAVKEAEKVQGVTLAEVYQAFLTDRALSPKTRLSYDDAMNRIFSDWLGKPVRSLNRNLIDRRFDEVSKSGQAAANLHFRVLRAVLNFAMEKYSTPDGEPLIPSNPVVRLTRLKKWHRIERRTRHLEPHQLKAWFQALEPRPDDSEHRNTVRDFCAFLLLTGCREQEAARLTWNDVDLAAAKVSFVQTKSHRPHVLPLGPWLTAQLQRRRQQTGGSPFVFPAENRSGHLMNHRKAVLAIAKDSGIEFRLHDLRRSFASIVNNHLERSLSAYTIKRLLNHGNGSDVTAGYVQVSIEDLREPMKQVEDFVLKCAGLKASASVVKLETTPVNARPVNRSAGLDAAG